MKKQLGIGNATLIFRNFSGEEGQYNPKGKRNFSIKLDQELAEELLQDGWNVKIREPKNEGDEPLCTLKVNVNMASGFPPSIYLITSKRKTLLTEETMGQLDFAEIENCDVVITPYYWNTKTESGISAYLKTLYCKIVEDEFANKYDDIPESEYYEEN